METTTTTVDGRPNGGETIDVSSYESTTIFSEQTWSIHRLNVR